MRLILLSILLSLVLACTTDSPSNKDAYQKVSGETMGTTYNITYEGRENKKVLVDSVLLAVNKDVNTYDPNSTISSFNNAAVGSDLSAKRNKHFIANYKLAMQVAQATNGAFDPTVMPLVNYWGFGYTPKKPVTAVDSTAIDSLLQLVGMDKLEYSNTILQKTEAGTQLDFSALAKGYGVDEVGRLLEADGVKNYMVEIGGEVRARGINPRGEAWTIGINRPEEGVATTELQASLTLENSSVATSGNYRNFYEVDGVKYSHTINPKTGFPERNHMLSASIVASDCMLADAYATACMVLDVDAAKTLIENTEGLEAYFIYSTDDGQLETFTSEKLKDKIKVLE